MILTAERLDRIAHDMTPNHGSASYRLGFWHGFASRLCPEECSHHRLLDTDYKMRDVRAGYHDGIRERVEWEACAWNGARA